MPTYVYEILDKKGKPTGKTFEIVQSMKEDALTEHPETGQKVRRAIVAPALPEQGSDTQPKSATPDMERTAGKFGPKTLGGGD